MKYIKLSNRLQAVADMLGNAAGVVDVGTDHGFLPVWFAQNRTASRLVAADIREGPLGRARQTAEDYGVTDRVEFILTDGLDGVSPDGLNAVVLAGMGGETIIRILENAPWALDGSIRCVLQPQSKTDVLTAWLEGRSCRITDAALAEDDGRLYQVFAVGGVETGVFRKPLELLLEKRDPLLPRYLSILIVKTRRTMGGLERSQELPWAEIGRLRAELEEYNRMKGETEKW